MRSGPATALMPDLFLSTFGAQTSMPAWRRETSLERSPPPDRAGPKLFARKIIATNFFASTILQKRLRRRSKPLLFLRCEASVDLAFDFHRSRFFKGDAIQAFGAQAHAELSCMRIRMAQGSGIRTGSVAKLPVVPEHGDSCRVRLGGEAHTVAGLRAFGHMHGDSGRSSWN